MNDIVKQLSAVSIENTRRTHILLDAVLVAVSNAFPGAEIRFNNTNVAFEMVTENVRMDIMRDLNRFTVDVRVSEKAAVIAECVMDIAGSYEERYAKFSNKDLKIKMATLFSDISTFNTDISEIEFDNADVEKDTDATASDGTPVEEVISAE